MYIYQPIFLETGQKLSLKWFVKGSCIFLGLIIESEK